MICAVGGIVVFLIGRIDFLERKQYNKFCYVEIYVGIRKE